ncbi:MAG TPA: FmdB family zinc ribbon protein [Actinomycetota bacterium]|nr:FmdB family zinc ribbon protein [Actinomycetota bacterium]
MPLYEYRCLECGSNVEVLHAMDGPAPVSCGECGGSLRRVWSRVGIRFSGWGFSSTDALLEGSGPRRDFRAVRERAEEIADQ